jgi:PAS domain S-box-containing protein
MKISIFWPLGSFLFPFLGFVFLLFSGLGEKQFYNPIIHGIVLSFASGFALYISFTAYRGYNRNRDPKVLGIALAFFAFGFIFLLHGMTPLSPLYSEDFFDVTEHYGLFIGSLLLLSSILPLQKFSGAIYLIKQKIFRGLVIGLLLATVLLVSLPALTKSLEATINIPIGLTGLLFFISLISLLRKYREGPGTLSFYLILAFAVLINSGLIPFFYKEWDFLWWHFHLVILLGFVLILRGLEFSQLEEDQNTFAAAIEQTDDLVIITNREGIIEYVNPAFEKFTGFSKAEVIGKKPSIASSGIQDKQFYEGLWKTVLSGSVFRAQLTNRKRNGELYVEDQTLTPIKDAYGNVIRFLSIGKDITEHKKAEEALERADHMKTEFMSMISHELRTPLTPINGYLQLLLQNKMGNLNDEQANALTIIQKQSTHLLTIIDSILDLSRLEQGKFSELKKEPLQLNKIVGDTAECLAEDFAGKQISIKFDLSDKSPVIFGDEDQLGRVIDNLLGNALKFTPKGGTVTIKTEPVDSGLRVEVADNGVGIAPENLERVFEKFFQVDSSYTRTAGGIGVGLTIARKIVEAHGGKLWAESEGVGKGSKFIFTLPIT